MANVNTLCLKRLFALALIPTLLTAPIVSHADDTAAGSELEQGFRQPPESTKPWCYWYWVNDFMSREGITRDLEAMAKFGIGEAFIGNVAPNEKERGFGPVKVLSDEWWGLVDHAIREGGRVGVRIGMFNCPGWSQSGGPWVKPEQSMRYITSSEKHLRGPLKFEGKLPAPKEQFQDVAVLAFPAPRLDRDTLATRSPRVTSRPEGVDVARLFDGRLDSAVILPASVNKEPLSVDVEVAEPFTARSLVLHPGSEPVVVTCELQAEEGGQFKSVEKFTLDRSNPNVNVGPMVFAPVVVSFPATTAKRFRIVFSDLRGGGGLTEVDISGAARVERCVEKQLGKMFPTPLPLWGDYLWPAQAALDDASLAVPAAQVRNLSAHLAADGTLRWDVPAGDWIVLRTGMTPTGVQNAPASPEATGLEIDKMNRGLIRYHFDQYVGKALNRLPASERKALNHVVADSYEMGSQNWTDGLAKDFRKRYGYDPLPWLPVLTGRVVGSPDESDRFLWDLRRLVADRVSYDYVGGLRDVSERHGLRLWLENYGHWGYPGEFLQYGGQSHDIGGEFWTGGDLGSVELRAASSAAHIYGKPTVSAESFTSGGPHWAMDPWYLRKRGDWSLAEGINHVLLHVYIEQPYENRVPGINAGFGTEFNRHNTWFSQAHDWVDYLKRTSFLLQQGRYVADVAYFIGEDTPKMTGTRQPALPEGYSFDYINGEVIEQRLAVKDGRFVLPGGMSYRVLVLPPLDTMRPELLAKLEKLVKAGGVILGPEPTRSPSLEGFPKSDRKVRQLARTLWQHCDGRTVTSVQYGKGRVFSGVELPAVFAQLGVTPDVTGLDGKSFPWLHRTMSEGEVYFISNQGDAPASLAPGFRVTGRQPELWDAVTGESRDLPEFRQENGHTLVPIEFAARQSLFVVFRKPALPSGGKNFPALATAGELTGPWSVSFDPKWGGPASVEFPQLTDWARCAEDGIKYYSGTAVYRKTFDLPEAAKNQRVYLDLGTVHNMARVKLNGQDLGLIWCAPWRMDITRAAKVKGNALELEVVNTWANRIIGDSKLPENQRLTWTIYPHYGPDSPLLPAGLIGPVTLQTSEPASPE